MKKLLLLLPLMMMMGCGKAVSPEQQKRDDEAEFNRWAKIVLDRSVVVCADGNQIRIAFYLMGGNASSFTAWTIVGENGLPKRCVRRPKQQAQEFEEVPQ